MKSWQDLFSTASDWMREHPSAVRWGAIAIISVVLLTWLANQSMFGQQTIALFDSRQLTSDEIGLMQVAFGKSDLNEYEIKGTQIEVPRNLRADYLKSLADHGAVPQDLTAHVENQSSFDFFQTRAQQRAQQINRKKQTIRDMVLQLRFVERAIVDYDETRGATPFDEMQRTAIVNVTPAGNRVLEMSEVKAIRDTVRGAVAGLQLDEITVIDTFASKSHAGSVAMENEPMQPHTLTKIKTERKYENKIRSALTAYPGIRVNVEVGVDPVVRRVRDKRSIEGEPLVVERVVQRETSGRLPSTSPSIFRNVFGQGANSQARVGSLVNPYKRGEERTAETTQSMANGTFETTETAGPVVTNVCVSIGIPERCVQYFVDKNTYGTQPGAEEIQRQRETVFDQLRSDIQQKVGPLVPAYNSVDQPAAPQIVVTLDRQIPMDSGPATQLTGAGFASLQDLVGYWPWIGLITFGLLALALFRPIGKSHHHSLRHTPGETAPAMSVESPSIETPARNQVTAEDFDQPLSMMAGSVPEQHYESAAVGVPVEESAIKQPTIKQPTFEKPTFEQPTISNPVSISQATQPVQPTEPAVQEFRETILRTDDLKDSPDAAEDSEGKYAGLDPNLEAKRQLRIQLDQWCRDNPQAAAATIHQWLERKAG